MSKFDTHGGYFAPKDYMRVNEGGSHEENPNGGVQIGVDPEGNPNLLEEGEPVYKDYVYSDNIEAEEQFLVDNNLPKKYTGKLYSKIADDLFTEAEERPLDPISRNGLEVLLGRLADAQEGQKQAKEQRDLEDELANLSPEELDQLEAMLSEGDQGPSGYPGDAGVQYIPEEQMMGPAESMPVEGMPMMANGGFLRKFDMGGPKKSMADEIAAEILAQADARGRASGIGNTDLPLVDEHPELDAALMIAQPGTVLEKALAPSAYRGIVSGLANGEDAIQLFAPFAKIGKGAKAALSATEIANINGKIADYGKDIASAEKELAALKKELDIVKNGGPGSRDVIKSGIEKANERIRFAKREQGRLRDQLPSEKKVVENTTKEVSTEPINEPVKTNKRKYWPWIATGAGVTGAGYGIEKLINAYSVPAGVDSGMLTPYTGYYSDDSVGDYDFNDEPTGPLKTYGGEINRYPSGGWLDFLNALGNYTYSRNPGGISGTYAIDKSFPLAKYNTIQELENSEPYRGFTDYVLANGANPEVLNYLRALDKGTANGVMKLFDGDNLRQGWEDIYRRRRYDQKGGIYHLNPADIGFLTAPAEPATATQNPYSGDMMSAILSQKGIRNPRGKAAPEGLMVTPHPISWENYTGSQEYSDEGNDNYIPATLPTWPRYAGAIGSGLLGLYNVFQQPDRYHAQRINPVLPEGRINLQNQVYNPIDQNMIANSIIAQGNATNRALRNSGLGPSSAAAILAADNNLTGNLGTGFIQAWDANNQRRNAVIAANNQAEAQRAQFDYTVDAARKEAINRFAPYNAQNNLMIQRLNNQAEADKYTAISNQISNGLQALSGIGQENFAMNQINTNPSFLGYRVGPNGAMFFNPNTGEWEKVKS